MNIRDVVGKKVKVYFYSKDEPIIGKCLYYTNALDNEPEIASIDIEGEYGVRYEFFENEIKKIEII